MSNVYDWLIRQQVREQKREVYIELLMHDMLLKYSPSLNQSCCNLDRMVDFTLDNTFCNVG